MENGECGINVAKPRAALDVRGSDRFWNYPTMMIGTVANSTCGYDDATNNPIYNTKSIMFVSKLGNEGYNHISQANDLGMFFSDGLTVDDGTTETGSNVSAGFVLAPRAAHGQFTDIGGLRMDNLGNVELRGDLRATRAKVDAKWWSDFVFDDDYKLPSLAEVEAFIKANKHLPNVPSEAEVLENGIDVANMQAIQQQKIEELTLYIIQLQKQMVAMQQVLSQLNGK